MILSCWYQKLLHWIAPPYCMKCKRFIDERIGLCKVCLRDVNPIASTVLDITRLVNMKVFAISKYEDPIRSLILKKSWGDISASVALGNLMWQLTDTAHVPFDCVIPVPLHWRRYAWRGYNQSEEMARVIADISGRPLLNVVRRTKYGPFQAHIKAKDRHGNVRDSFELCDGAKQALANKHVLLVDDLMTTGATLRSVARLLLFSGARGVRVTAVVASRTG